jgi:hypothetical protein
MKFNLYNFCIFYKIYNDFYKTYLNYYNYKEKCLERMRLNYIKDFK